MARLTSPELLAQAAAAARKQLTKFYQDACRAYPYIKDDLRALYEKQLAALEGKAKFGFWEKFDDTHTVMRIATSWATRMEEIDGLLALL